MNDFFHHVGHWCMTFFVCIFAIVLGVIFAVLFVVVALIFMCLAILTFPIVNLFSLHTSAYIDENIKKYEGEVLKQRVKGNIYHLDRKIVIRPSPTEQICIELHVLHIKSVKNDAPVIVLIHGAAASSLSFVDTMDALSATFDVYVIDLPGFGRSHVNRSFRDISKMYEDSADFHCNVIREFLKSLKKERVYLCGHSFGAYVCVRFCKNFPAQVAGLILINAAGIFPTLGGLGMYWACVFKGSIPNVGKYFGRPGYVIMTHFLRSSTEALYWYYILAHPRGFGDLFVREKITFYYVFAYWNKPSFDHFDEFQCPVCLIYGEDDTIMPAHQGMLLQQIHGFELRLIKNNGHSPINNVEGAAAVAKEILTFFFEQSERLCDVVPRPKASTTAIILPSSYKGSFYVPKMYAVINRLYDDIGKRYGVNIDVDPKQVEKLNR